MKDDLSTAALAVLALILFSGAAGFLLGIFVGTIR